MKEDINTEFKSSFTDAAIESLVAFANTKGGSVYVGVDDMGNPLNGFTIGTESLQKWVNDVKLKTQPSIIPDADIVNINGVEVARLSINEFPVKPISFRGRYYRRVKNSNHQLNTSEISEMYMQSLQLSWDSYPYPKASLDDLNGDKIEQFINKVNDGGRFFLPSNHYKALLNLKLIKDKMVTNAAMILFSKENLFCNVHVGRFKTQSFIIDERMIRGNLFDVVEETLRFINSHIKVAFEITGVTTQRTEIFEYPIAAIRELVLNAVIHRDYLSPSDVQIKIFDKSITFYNPGNLYGKVTIEDLGKDNYTSELRNKLIAEAFYLTKDIEKYGTGFFRVRKELLKYPTMVFQYHEQGNGFVAQLSYVNQKVRSDFKVGNRVGDRVGNKVGERVGKKLTDNQLKIIEAIKKNGKISFVELAREIGIGENSIGKNVKKLQQLNILFRVGAARGGYWTVNF